MIRYSRNIFAALAGHEFAGHRRWNPAMSAGVCPGFGEQDLQSKTNVIVRLQQITCYGGSGVPAPEHRKLNGDVYTFF